MALIKPIYYKGFYPYWWTIKYKRIDSILNKTEVALQLYADSETAEKDKGKNLEYIPGFTPIATLDGSNNTDEDCYSAIIAQNNNPQGLHFNDCTNTNGSYILKDHQSPIYLELDGLDPVTNQVRIAECAKHTIIWNNDIITLVLTIHFKVDDVVDLSLDRTIVWVIDDFNAIPNSGGIGEYTYFKNLRLSSGFTDEQIISLGIQYGNSMGYVDKKLYGN